MGSGYEEQPQLDNGKLVTLENPSLIKIAKLYIIPVLVALILTPVLLKLGDGLGNLIRAVVFYGIMLNLVNRIMKKDNINFNQVIFTKNIKTSDALFMVIIVLALILMTFTLNGNVKAMHTFT